MEDNYLIIERPQHWYFQVCAVGLYKVAKELCEVNSDIDEPSITKEFIKVDRRYLQDYLNCVVEEFLPERDYTAGGKGRLPLNNIYSAKKFSTKVTLPIINIDEFFLHDTKKKIDTTCVFCNSPNIKTDLTGIHFPSSVGSGGYNFNLNYGSAASNKVCVVCNYLHWFIGVLAKAQVTRIKTAPIVTHFIPFSNDLLLTYRAGEILTQKVDLEGVEELGDLRGLQISKKEGNKFYPSTRGGYFHICNMFHKLYKESKPFNALLFCYEIQKTGKSNKTSLLETYTNKDYNNVVRFFSLLGDFNTKNFSKYFYVKIKDDWDSLWYVRDRVCKKILENEDISEDILTFIFTHLKELSTFQIHGLLDILQKGRIKMEKKINFRGFAFGQKLREAVINKKGDVKKIPPIIHKLLRARNQEDFALLLLKEQIGLNESFEIGQGIDYTNFEWVTTQILGEVLKGYTYKNKTEESENKTND